MDLVQKAQVRYRRAGGSLDTPLNADADNTRLDLTPDLDATNPAEAADRADTARLFGELMKELPDRPRDIIRRHLDRGQTFAQIGEAYGFTAQRAQSLYQSAIGLTRARLKARLRKGETLDSLRENGPMPLLSSRLDPQAIAEADREFEQQASADWPATLRAYDRLPLAHGGKVIDTDVARSLYAPYATSKDGARDHTPSTGRIAGQVWRKRTDLAIASAKPGDVFVFMAGGPASGKSTTVQKLVEEPAVTHIIDGTFSGEFFNHRNRIKKLIKAGAMVQVRYVFKPAGDAVAWMVNRASKIGRFIPKDQMVKLHWESQQNIARLLAEHPEVAISLIDAEKGTSTPLTNEALNRIQYRELHELETSVTQALARYGSGAGDGPSGTGETGGGQGQRPTPPQSPVSPGGAARPLLSQPLDPEADGERTVGNPNLANPAGPDRATRAVLDSVDEQRKNDRERGTNSHPLRRRRPIRLVQHPPQRLPRSLRLERLGQVHHLLSAVHHEASSLTLQAEEFGLLLQRS